PRPIWPKRIMASRLCSMAISLFLVGKEPFSLRLPLRDYTRFAAAANRSRPETRARGWPVASGTSRWVCASSDSAPPCRSRSWAATLPDAQVPVKQLWHRFLPRFPLDSQSRPGTMEQTPWEVSPMKRRTGWAALALALLAARVDAQVSRGAIGMTQVA